MLTELTESVRETSRSAARELRGFRRRQFQADPKFQTPPAYTRITAKAVREPLVANAARDGRQAPAERTL